MRELNTYEIGRVVGGNYTNRRGSGFSPHPFDDIDDTNPLLRWPGGRAFNREDGHPNPIF